MGSCIYINPLFQSLLKQFMFLNSRGQWQSEGARDVKLCRHFPPAWFFKLLYDLPSLFVLLCGRREKRNYSAVNWTVRPPLLLNQRGSASQSTNQPARHSIHFHFVSSFFTMTYHMERYFNPLKTGTWVLYRFHHVSAFYVSVTNQ